MAEQVQSPAQIDEPAAGGSDRRAVVLPEVGDGLEVGSQPSGQPHQLDVALSLPLQPAARGDLVDVAVDIDLQQHTWMIGWPSGRLGNHPLEPKRPQVQLLDEHVDHSDRVLLRHIVVQELGKQNALPAVPTFDEALHLQLRSSVVEILAQPVFSHSLDP